MWTRALRRVGWALSFALVVLLMQSMFWAEHVPWELKLAVAGVALLSAWRPADGLVVVAGFVPFSLVLTRGIWQADPFAVGEALVLAFLTGYLWQQRQLLGATSSADTMVVPSRLFALVVLASCFVQLVVLQVWHDHPLRYAASFLKFLATGYLTKDVDPRPWVDGRSFLGTPALLLEGVALLRSASTLCGRQPALARRLTNVIIAAGVGVAILGFGTVIAVAFESHQPIGSVIRSERWSSPAIPSLNTAGPYCMLVAFMAIGTAAASRSHLLPGLLAAVISIAAMWLTRTRAAIVAGLATVVAGLVWWGSARVRWLSPARAVLAAVLVALTVGVGVTVYNPFQVLAAGGHRSLHLRVLLAQTGLRMMAHAPLAGVGVGQYEWWYADFASPEMLQYYARNNAHNYLLWMGAELGLLGLVPFVWLLVASLGRVWSHLRSRQPRSWFLGIVAGLVSFISTWSIGQPLGVPQVAYTFWIVLGLAAAYSSDDAPGAARGRPQPLRNRIALAALILVVVGSVPIRARRAISEIDLSRVSYGFHDWETTNEGRRFRWTGPQASFFLRSSVKAIEVPLAVDLAAAPRGVQVDVAVDGHALDRLMLTDENWRIVAFSAPATTGRYWRVDLHVSPVWITRTVQPGGSPQRELGVAVGEVQLIAK